MDELVSVQSFENTAEQNTPTEVSVAPRVADVTTPADTDTPDKDNSV